MPRLGTLLEEFDRRPLYRLQVFVIVVDSNLADGVHSEGIIRRERVDLETKLVAPTFAAQEHYWDDRWGRHQRPNGYQKERAEKVLEFIRDLHLSRPRILDLGCATGWFTRQLACLGEATGVDLSPRAIEIARRQFPGVDYKAGNFYEMSFPPDHFDLIVNQEVIAHVPDQTLFLDRIARILKPGGHLVITTANKFVMDRVDSAPDPDSHIKTWLSMADFKRLMRPHFNVLRATSVIPLGNRGILRIVNSHKLNRLFGIVLSPEQLNRWKGGANLGYSLIVLAQKK